MKTVTIIAIIAIAFIQAVAIYTKLDGQLLAYSIAAIAGLGGYAMGKFRA